MVQTKLRIHVPFLQSLLWLSFRFSRPSLSVKGTKPRGEYLILSWWNWFVHYGKLDSRTKFAIPEFFFYHLPKPWTDWFAHVNGKQPRFCTIRRVTSHTCYTEKTADIFPARVHTSQPVMQKLDTRGSVELERDTWVSIEIFIKNTKSLLLVTAYTHWKQHFKANWNDCTVILYKSAFTWPAIMSSTPEKLH